MINPTGKKLEKLLFGIFDEAIQGVDTYNHNGSIWLIFTDEMKWVVEYTQAQTLWYNYYFFKNEMEIIGLDCVENRDLIQKWFESRFLNKNEVKETNKSNSNYRLCVEDTIQNKVKHIKSNVHPYPKEVEDTIQNGVKNTESTSCVSLKSVEDTIQNGIKETKRSYEVSRKHRTKNTIQNGVKQIDQGIPLHVLRSEDTIENGVKEK